MRGQVDWLTCCIGLRLGAAWVPLGAAWVPPGAAWCHLVPPGMHETHQAAPGGKLGGTVVLESAPSL